MTENLITRSARTIKGGEGHFKARSGVHRPLLTRPEFYATVIPLSLSVVSCTTPQGMEATPGPTVIETPKPLSELVAAQITAGDPLAGYSSTESRQNDAFIKQNESKYGKLENSRVIVGIDGSNNPVMSEIFDFEKGDYVVFYDKDGKAVSDMSELKINYGYDKENGNLLLNFKAEMEDGEGGVADHQFLTFASTTTIDQLSPDVLEKLQKGDPSVNVQLLSNFDQDQLSSIDYINPTTGQSVVWKKSAPNWNKVTAFLKTLNPLYASPVQAAPAETATAEATATTPPPAVNAEVTKFDGDIKVGEVKGKDYTTGKDSDWTVEATSVKANNYNDSVFSTVVTGEATDASGQKFTVIWNEEGNYWFKSENINPDLNTANRTSFGEQLPGMVSNRDLYRMLLTQMDMSFSADTQTAQFWMVPRSASIDMNEFFYSLDMSRAGFSDDGIAQPNAQGEDLPDYQDIQYGGFAKGKEPYKPLAMIDGIAPAWTDSQNNRHEGKEFTVFPTKVQNSDGKTMIWFPGMDAIQREALLTGADTSYGVQKLLIDNVRRLNLVIPPADPAMWDNYEKAGGNNGGIHYRDGNVNFADDAIISMQDEPGVFFNLLPKDMQDKLNNGLTEIKNGRWLVFHAVPFEGNAIPQNVVDYLSSHIFETYFDSNPWSQ